MAIDGRTATARWDGQPVDYDQAVMVAMASWGPGGTGSEAAATAANANPRQSRCPIPDYARSATGVSRETHYGLRSRYHAVMIVATSDTTSRN